MQTVYPLTMTAAAATTAAAPTVTPWPLILGWLEQVTIDVPVGHNGNTGIRIKYHGQQVFPFDPSSYAVLSPGRFAFPWKDQVDSVGFTVEAFSVGRYSHQYFLFAEIDPSRLLGNANIMAPGADSASFGYDTSGMGGLSFGGGTVAAPPKAKKPKTPKENKILPKHNPPEHHEKPGPGHEGHGGHVTHHEPPHGGHK
jgi:hypothetical protein